MRILVTGHDGYIGTVVVPMLRGAGHEIRGLDSYLFEGCSFGPQPDGVPSRRGDVRDVTASVLEGFDAVIHLAAISNDPVADLDPTCTDAINRAATVRVARLAKQAGVPRLLFASSCSLYGAADPDDLLDEQAPLRPITAYGRSKVMAERELAELADEGFSPVFLRNATVYGVSPRLRLDVVVNNLVAAAHATGEVLLMSDGTPWRPLVHVEDLARTFLAVVEAPRALVHNEVFNVGSPGENYQIAEVARIARDVMPGTRVVLADGAGPDPRCYRVDFSKLHRAFPELRMQWEVRRGIEQLAAAYDDHGLTAQDLVGPRFTRLRHIRVLLEQGELDGELRRRQAAPAGAVTGAGEDAPAQ